MAELHERNIREAAERACAASDMRLVIIGGVIFMLSVISGTAAMASTMPEPAAEPQPPPPGAAVQGCVETCDLARLRMSRVVFDRSGDLVRCECEVPR